MKHLVLVLFVVFSLMINGAVQADDGAPYCESSYHDYGNGVASSSQPLCNGSWTSDVEANFILPSMTQIGMTNMGWTDTGMGNPITRIFNDHRIDLSDVDNTVRYAEFEDATHVSYVLGATLAWGPGAAEDPCGFYMRYTDGDDGEHFYKADVNQNSFLDLEENSAGNWNQIDSKQVSDLNTGFGATNTLMIIVLRDYFYIFLNGTWEIKASDATDMDLESGAGLAASTFSSSDQTYCDFHNAWIWPIDNWQWS